MKYSVTYKKLADSFSKEKIPNNILLSIEEKVLLDDLVKIICENFGGKNFDARNNLISFNAEDRQNENIINECSNSGLFAEKKVVVLKNVKKLLKAGKLSLIDYLKRSNPDTCLIMTSADEELSVEKIFLLDSRSSNKSSETSGSPKISRKDIEDNVKIYQVNGFSENELIGWVKEKFDDYKIDNETIIYFLQFSNNDLDEILSEIEKLKTFCYYTKEITPDAVNLCNGIAKEFDEKDFIIAVTERKKDVAMKIYDHISLKKDSEVYLVILLSSAFVCINKLSDPAVSRLDGFNLRRELKLWIPGWESIIPYYKNFRKSFDQEKINAAFDHIHSADKSLKSTGGDKKMIMSRLINNICDL
ncbi:MAG TPA: DNA polymerase III subunit delta [Ignavibacteria bacterium]|nr:DNA polymerase III subunit delta [Ignavibacteria bacterium]HMR41149.1 DNA polymerase III subunit delta [Ignavibacteria bacterium]